MIKKILITLSLVIIVLVIGLVVVNRFDETLNPQAYTLANLKPASFDPGNGFYLLWGLAEPEGVEVQSEEYTKPFRKVFDPAERDKKSPPTENLLPEKNKFKTYFDAITTLRFPLDYTEDWITKMNPQMEKLPEAQNTCALLLKRYQALITAPRVEDFSYPGVDIPIPNLLGLLRTVKLYTAIAATRAVKGEWQEAVADLLLQVNFARRFIPTARPFVTNLIAKGVMDLSLQGLVSILNHPGCPPVVYEQVIEGLPPLEYEEYGNRNSLIFECLQGFGLVDEPRDSYFEKAGAFKISGFPERLFLQKNTTKNYFYDYFSRAITFDTREPYLWKVDPEKELRDMIESKITGFFGKLKNYYGKTIFSIVVPNIYGTIFTAYRLRCRYEMTRLLAELKLGYSPGENIGDVLPRLKTYRWNDPFSGKPYRWNPEKKVLYSIGIDGVDNGGVENKTLKTDIIIPVVVPQEAAAASPGTE